MQLHLDGEVRCGLAGGKNIDVERGCGENVFGTREDFFDVRDIGERAQRDAAARDS